VLLGLNNRNQEVGFFKDSVGDSHGFVINGAVMAELPQAPGARSVSTIPAAINDNGVIAGYFGVQFGPPNNSGFLLGPGGFTLINVPGALETFVMGLDNRGDLVGYSDPGATSGFLFKNAAFSATTFPNSPFTSATGINSQGTIVGWYSGSDFFAL
jgi:uncharacterized membrane protein